MYDNIGAKIKSLAIAVFIIEAVASVAWGIYLLDSDKNDLSIRGLVFMIAGPFIAWISSWVLYGFGELIEKVSGIELNTRENGSNHKLDTYDDLEAETTDDYDTELFDETTYLSDQEAGNNPNTYLKDYWICGRCGWHNFNKQSECWKCSNPKE